MIQEKNARLQMNQENLVHCKVRNQKVSRPNEQVIRLLNQDCVTHSNSSASLCSSCEFTPPHNKRNSGMMSASVGELGDDDVPSKRVSSLFFLDQQRTLFL